MSHDKIKPAANDAAIQSNRLLYRATSLFVPFYPIKSEVYDRKRRPITSSATLSSYQSRHHILLRTVLYAAQGPQLYGHPWLRLRLCAWMHTSRLDKRDVSSQSSIAWPTKDSPCLPLLLLHMHSLCSLCHSDRYCLRRSPVTPQ